MRTAARGMEGEVARDRGDREGGTEVELQWKLIHYSNALRARENGPGAEAFR